MLAQLLLVEFYCIQTKVSEVLVDKFLFEDGIYGGFETKFLK